MATMTLAILDLALISLPARAITVMTATVMMRIRETVVMTLAVTAASERMLAEAPTTRLETPTHLSLPTLWVKS